MIAVWVKPYTAEFICVEPVNILDDNEPVVQYGAVNVIKLGGVVCPNENVPPYVKIWLLNPRPVVLNVTLYLSVAVTTWGGADIVNVCIPADLFNTIFFSFSLFDCVFISRKYTI